MAEEKIFLHRFWEYYLDAQVIPPFKALRDKKGEEASSRIMWYVHFLHDPEHEFLYKLPKSEREKLLFDFCEIKKQDLKGALYENVVEYYTTQYMSKTKRVLAMFGEKVELSEQAIKSGNIFDAVDIATFTSALKAFRELAKEYESALASAQKEISTAKNNRLFGKDGFVGAADDSSLFQ